jgi:hypothetical protein
MADKSADTTEGTSSNTEVTAEAPLPEPQKANQFTTLGWTEASRQEDTAAQEAEDREAAQKAAKK